MSLDALREALAELAHQQWEHWSRSAAAGGASPNQIAQWSRNWRPYAELNEQDKDADRVWADKILTLLAQQRAAAATISAKAPQDA